ARTNKLVVLDATGMGADWSLGMLHNDFARAVDGMESEIIAIPNLAVVSASGPDQLSWPDEAARRTVFGRVLLQGLKGGAEANADDLRRAWDRARELSRLTPPPARYAPYAWARYQAALLRYEQLLRAGDADHAADVAGMLPELEQQIRQSGRLPLISAENTLA